MVWPAVDSRFSRARTTTLAGVSLRRVSVRVTETVTSAPIAAGWRIILRVAGIGSGTTRLYAAKLGALTVKTWPELRPEIVNRPEASVVVLDVIAPASLTSTDAFGTAPPR